MTWLNPNRVDVDVDRSTDTTQTAEDLLNRVRGYVARARAAREAGDDATADKALALADRVLAEWQVRIDAEVGVNALEQMLRLESWGA